MGEVEKFSRALSKFEKVALDTMCFAYYFEKNEYFFSLCEVIFQKLDVGKINAVTSILALAEVLVSPKKIQDIYTESIYKKVFFSHPYIQTVNFGFEIADLCASLRAKYNLKTPDAIHLATAISSDAKALITNDPKLKQIKEMPVLVLREYL